MAASIRNTSSKAASRAGLGGPSVSEAPCALRRHSSAMPHRLTPAAPPSVRTKLMTLEPCEISSWCSPRMAPRLSEGRMKPRPTRPTMAQLVSSHSTLDARPMLTIPANDSVSSASPIDTSQRAGIRSAQRDASAMAPPSARLAGSSTVPTCAADRPSPICMYTGST